MNYLDLTVSEIQILSHLDTMGENNTQKALKGCGVKTTLNSIVLKIQVIYSLSKCQNSYYSAVDHEKLAEQHT